MNDSGSEFEDTQSTPIKDKPQPSTSGSTVVNQPSSPPDPNLPRTKPKVVAADNLPKTHNKDPQRKSLRQLKASADPRDQLKASQIELENSKAEFEKAQEEARKALTEISVLQKELKTSKQQSHELGYKVEQAVEHIRDLQDEVAGGVKDLKESRAQLTKCKGDLEQCREEKSTTVSHN